jgi:hypothetical protein
MSRSLGEIKNFGPYMVKIMNEIGIYTEKDLLETSYRSIQDKLLAMNIKPHLLIFYSIDMGLQERKWNDITPSQKEEIKKTLNSGLEKDSI